MRMRQTAKDLIKILIVAALVIPIISVFAAWQEPRQSPPGGNVPAPLNVSSTAQIKEGGLWLNTGGASTGLIVDKGKVGIGTTGPDRPLTVQGTGANHELLSFKDNAGATKWFWNMYGSAGLNLAEAGVADGRLFIKYGGYVGIGTTTPAQKLDVSGNVQFSGALMPAGNAGTAGQALISQGPGTPPTWEYAGGGLVSIKVFDKPGTYTWVKPDGVTKVLVEVQGGGGGGGGGASEGSWGQPGQAGGASSFGAFIRASGGSGGSGGAPKGWGTARDGAGGTGSGGYLNIKGEDGQGIERPSKSFLLVDLSLSGRAGVLYGGGGTGGESGADEYSRGQNGGGGGAGGYSKGLITNPGPTETVIVGAGGRGGRKGSGYWPKDGYPGASGIVIIYEYK